MALRSTLFFVVAAAIGSWFVVWPFVPDPRTTAAYYRMEIGLRAEQPGHAQLFWDLGFDYRENESSRADYEAGRDVVLNFPLPAKSIRALRFDPNTGPVRMTILHARILTRYGEVLREIRPSQFKPSFDIAAAEEQGGRLLFTSAPGAIDPILLVEPFAPLDLASLANEGDRKNWRWAKASAAVFVGLLLLGLASMLLSRSPRTIQWIRARGEDLRRRPALAIALVALVAVVLSTYPVAILGKSFVSPNLGSTLLYQGLPTVPGVTATERAEIKGADIGALMWQHVPFSRIQHRALAEGELPLWNRYNSGGVTLFGQGQSVFGNPLHLLPLAANGAAWAWDLKFLLAKWLFAVGAGTIVWSLTRHFPAAILTTFSAPFIGFFIYRVNHPAIFSLCYAPWVLYAWQRAISTRSWREFAPWGAFWLFANFTLLTSGTAKEAVILLVMMNLAGGLMLLCASAPWRQRGRWLITFALLSGLFLLISAPHWLLFVHSLGTAYTSYDLGEAFQIPPGLLVALFDEIFYRPFQHEEIVINPSGNFLMLLGVLSLAVRWRQAWADRTVRALLLAALIPTLLVFGVIPPAWLVALPVLSGIQHIDNTFACPLLILMLVLAGWGWREVWERCGTQEGRVELVLIVALLLGCLGLYLGTAQAILRSAYGDFSWAFRVNVSPWIMHYTAALIAATITGFVILRRTRRPRTVSPAQLTLLALCLFALLWRHGFHGAASNLNYTVVPPARADLYAPSPTIGYLTAATNADPARVAGLGDMFFPGWTGAYALETISGPDALMNRRYRELMIATGIERMWDWRYVVRAQTLAKLRPLYDALNLGYLVASRHDPLAPFTGYESVLRADTQVLRSPTVWPRAFFVEGVSGYSDLDAHVARLREGTGPFAAVDDRDPNLPNELPRTEGSSTHVAATNYRLTTNSTSFDIEAPSAGVVVLLEAYLKNDFKVEINGRPSGYFRVNHAFKGVVLPAAGRYRISCTYRPPLFVLGLYLAAGGLLVTIGGFIVARRHDAIFP